MAVLGSSVGMNGCTRKFCGYEWLCQEVLWEGMAVLGSSVLGMTVLGSSVDGMAVPGSSVG
jgi:hypothetical protein